MKICIALALKILIFANLSAQDIKREYEKSISPEELPERILREIQPLLEDGRKIRYFFEQGTTEDFYEVKMIWRDRHLSVEFYSDGRLMDVEELINFDQIPDKPREQISDYFESNCSRYRFTRVQRQYMGEEEDEEEDEEDNELIEDFMEDDLEDLQIRYEIEAFVKVENDEQFGPFEFLFSADGKLLQSRKIVERSGDNVRY